MKALTAQEALNAIAAGATSRIAAPDRPPRFAVGDPVRTRNLHPRTHTRLPRYVRGKVGTIAMIHGVFALPDTNATGEGRNEQYCYSVSFDSTELWGPQGRPGDRLYIDLWDDYLDPA
jgi:nitrile hydratase